MLVTVTPNPALDIVMVVREPRLSTLNRAERVYSEPSGKGLNVSRALAALGLRSSAVAPLGGPFGSAIRDALQAASFELTVVPIAGETRANTKILGGPGRALTEFNSPGPELSAAEWRALEDAVAGLAGSGDAVALSGSLPSAAPASAYRSLVERLRTAGAFTVLDADGAALREALPSRPDAIKPNRREAAELIGSPITTLGDAAEAADALRALGAGTVILTLDRLGALLATGERTVLAIPPAIRTRNVTGAGDAALAGFLAGRAASEPVDALARLCVAAGTARAAARAGAYGDPAAVRSIRDGVDAFVLNPAARASWAGLSIDELTSNDLGRALSGRSGRPAKGRQA